MKRDAESAPRVVFTRARTAAARIAGAPSVAIAAKRAISTPIQETAASKPSDNRIYKLEAAELLPVINLRLTISWWLLKSKSNLMFLKWSRQHFRVLIFANRIGLLLGMVAVAVPRSAATYLVIPACALAVPSSCCSYAMLSIDMLLILVRQYEFWFFSVINLATWSVLASMCRDIRVAFFLVVFFDVELLVVNDANFRTFVPAITTCACAIPVLVVLAALVFLRLIDLPPHQLRSIRLGKLDLEASEIFLNAILTLLLFLLRKVYNKRKLLYTRHASTRVVRCVILRSKLVARPLASHKLVEIVDDNAPKDHEKRMYGSRVVLKKLGITAQKEVPGIRAGRATNSRQQLTLVSLRLSIIDASRTLYSPWWDFRLALQTRHFFALYSIGALGLLLSGGSMLLPAKSDSTDVSISVSWGWIVAIPLLAFGCTAVFCLSFACAYQRDFARAMLRNFGFLFPSLQFSLACVCLADAMRWDNRCWAIASYCMWFHWIMLLDALTPPTRSQLRFRKHFAVPVVFAVWIGMISVLYAIVVDSPMLNDRQLIKWHVGKHDLTAGTKSILLNRIITILLWTLRLMWQILNAKDAELVLIRGTLDYYCPFDTCSGTARRGSLKSVLPEGARRDSDGSVLLLPSTEWSLGRVASLRQIGRRVSSLRQLPVHPSCNSISTVASMVDRAMDAAAAHHFQERQVERTLSMTILETDIASVRTKECARPLRRGSGPNQQRDLSSSPTLRELKTVFNP